MSVGEPNHRPADRLIVVLDTEQLKQTSIDFPLLTTELLSAGARTFWLRNKANNPLEQLQWARALISLVEPLGGRVIVGDRADVAAVAGAHGVHLTSLGLAVSDVRELTKISLIGRSCHDFDQVLRAEQQGADYCTLSPVFAPISAKPGSPTPLGLDLLRKISRDVSIPVFALGGIDDTNAGLCLSHGAYGVASLGAVTLSRHPGNMAKTIIDLVEHELVGS